MYPDILPGILPDVSPEKLSDDLPDVLLNTALEGEGDKALFKTMVYFGQTGSRIEGRYFKQKKPKSPVVLILPPDPRYKGDINNVIVRAFEAAFVTCGFTTLSINYKGCGRSEGKFRQVFDAIAAASKALDWLHSQNTDTSCFWIAGYSFGAYVAADIGTRRPEIEGFIFASPLIGHYDFSFMYPSLCSGLILSGENDELVDKQKLAKFMANINKGYDVDVQNIVIPEAEHNYRGHIGHLVYCCISYISVSLATRIFKPIKKKRRKRQRREEMCSDE